MKSHVIKKPYAPCHSNMIGYASNWDKVKMIVKCLRSNIFKLVAK